MIESFGDKDETMASTLAKFRGLERQENPCFVLLLTARENQNRGIAVEKGRNFSFHEIFEAFEKYHSFFMRMSHWSP